VAERQDSDREVLTSLPRSRPVRRSAKRGDRPDAANRAKASAKTPSRRAAPGSPRAKKTTAAAAGAGAAKAASSRAAKPGATRSARPSSKAARAAPDRARATPPTRKVPPAGYAAPTSRAEEPVTSGTAELISTTIQATAELAQIGLTVGRQTLQSMLDRLPKP
jgi:hypothetical protein